MWNVLWLACLRVGFWCQCTWFGFFGSRLIRSNNQSSATLCVLETCLIVGLLPFCNHLDHCFVVFKHIFPVLSWFWVVFPRTETIRSHKSRAGIPSNLNPASKEMISDSVELCETEVCFLHIQLIGTNAWLPKTHNIPLDVDFWIL